MYTNFVGYFPSFANYFSLMTGYLARLFGVPHTVQNPVEPSIITNTTRGLTLAESLSAAQGDQSYQNFLLLINGYKSMDAFREANQG